MSTFRYNVSTPHPIMPTPTDTAQYEEEHYYVSVHSEDRNVLKYPNSGDFEIEFPRGFPSKVIKAIYNSKSTCREGVKIGSSSALGFIWPFGL